MTVEFLTQELGQGMLDEARKVIAVHINYPSRAAQRGRTPQQPSYFLKPSSSLALGSEDAPGTVERPAGCELLGYEGEIALVIGKSARRVGLEDALEPRRMGYRFQRPRRVRPPLRRQGLQRPVQGRRRFYARWAQR